MRAISPLILLISVLVSGVAHAELPPAYSIVERIAGADGGWDFSSVDAAHGKLYVARSNAVMAVDLATRKVTDALAPANGGHQVLTIDGGRTVVETDGKSGLTRFIDAATGKVETEIATGQKPDAAFYDATTNRVVVVSPGSDTITQIDATTRRVVNSFALPGGLEFAEADGKGGAFVNLETGNALGHIDLRAGKVVRTTALTGCEGPTGLALVADGTRAISACANGIAAITDTATGKLVGTLAIGRGPDAVIADPARGLAFIPCGASGTLVIVSTRDPTDIKVVGELATQVSARSGALDPRDGRLYLPAATLGPAAPGARHGTALPGSFVVLVVAPRG